MTVHALPLKSPTSVTEADLQTPSTLTLVVENMHCGGCLKSVERAAMGVPGVSRRAREFGGEAGHSVL